MAEEPKTSEESSDEAESEEVDPELKAQAERDAEVSTPGRDAPAEPYYAIMTVEDGQTTGNVWSYGPRIMLFYEEHVANKILHQLQENHDLDWELRGVTEDHLEALKRIADSQEELGLFVIVGFPQGKVEAVPLEEHVPHKKPPPLPPGLSKGAPTASDEKADEDQPDEDAEGEEDDEGESESDQAESQDEESHESDDAEDDNDDDD